MNIKSNTCITCITCAIILLEVSKLDKTINTTLAVSKLTTKCQATIPKSVRDILKLDKDDQVAFVMNQAGEIVLQKVILG